MPMERRRYPPDWDAIARQVKQQANWTCQACDRPCRRPGEDVKEFCDRVATRDDRWGLKGVDGTYRLGRFVLTVAHLDQTPSNNDPANLKALCPACHLKHDAPYRQANAYAKRERRGQLNLIQPHSATPLEQRP